MRMREYKLALKNVYNFAKMYFAVLQYIFAMYFAFNWKQACSFMYYYVVVNLETKCERP
jgi:hypothetical protein